MASEADEIMYKKGYRYILKPVSKTFEPLYVKTLDNVSLVCMDYKDEKFDVDELVLERRQLFSKE